MKKAYCYGVWGDKYYRTEDGHTFCIKLSLGKKLYFYHGNVITGENCKVKLLSDDEAKLLLTKVEFID